MTRDSTHYLFDFRHDDLYVCLCSLDVSTELFLLLGFSPVVIISVFYGGAD